ncbi:UDP-glucose--hexose-1-phosphate uridylyltransferase [Bacillus sp. mrc49]|uniref:UDP-glucose--hexose-1-phosphate uridylyltransferase n=1 Tax=Bacillus sp. mrc49 TaxID=2054913 RepID=UPI000C277A97|nr:UDP-glucose--hexose-1-phosphate uridylyltransferase [Bacillus sp. mrc49]PJN88378.1 UDP-glucose--hexose-1-phosphate uridylyltransferase [Bacillus sp. mrc49]
MDIYTAIQTLLNRAVQLNLMVKEDEIYSRNQMMAILHLEEFPLAAEERKNAAIPDLLEEMAVYASEKGIVGDLDIDKEILSSKIMNVLIKKPSEVNGTFYEKYQQDPKAATEYFYRLSQNSNYIQMKHIHKNINYKLESQFGELDITINLSKPEKDPRQIALEKEKRQALSYPRCLLCVENEGYNGRIGHPARSNHRTIRLELTDERWHFQFSPYVYYNEHCIVLSEEHRDMKITKGTFSRLLEFVEKFPHYFIGSNADLPIVGGSILNHDHYQGGRYEFAMENAAEEFRFTMDGFPEVIAHTLKWPMSVIRLRSENKEELMDAAADILEKWRLYSDEGAEIIAYSGETPHNTITPIARWKDGHFELDLVLRNNRTNDEHPDGIFHPHRDVHHIKKENIGLIEVMGLAVLPARLKAELEEIEAYLLGGTKKVQGYHSSWANEIKARYDASIGKETVQGILRKELGVKFLRTLEDAGVFKRDLQGQQAFRRFCLGL